MYALRLEVAITSKHLELACMSRGLWVIRVCVQVGGETLVDQGNEVTEVTATESVVAFGAPTIIFQSRRMCTLQMGERPPPDGTRRTHQPFRFGASLSVSVLTDISLSSPLPLPVISRLSLAAIASVAVRASASLLPRRTLNVWSYHSVRPCT